ncbi:MAG: lipoate--protein ligase family protein [Gemmatimonadaceae bacterium]
MPSTPPSDQFFQRHPWRLLVSPAESGPTNMAIDEALLARTARAEEGVLRVYRWRAPTLSLGRHQTARNVYDPSKAAALGVSLVRRMTGGRALLHWREVTYSVTAPLGAEALSESYAAINGLLLDALRDLGIAVTIAKRSIRLPSPASAPCFELPAEGEILFDGRKLVGSAQFRSETGLLQHGSILIADDQALVSRLAARAVGDVAAAATLVQSLGREPDFDEVAGALTRALALRTETPVTLFDVGELDADVQKLSERYASDAWTWLR